MARALGARWFPPLCALALAACAPPLPCGTAEVSPGTARTTALLAADRPVVPLSRGESALPFLLDTGFRRSALGPSALGGDGHGASAQWTLEDIRIRADFAAWSSASAAGVLGAEVLEQLPLEWDAAAGRLSISASFPLAMASDAVLHRHALRDCGDPGVAFTLEISVEGQRRTFLLDSGAALSVVRTSVAGALQGQPGLAGLRLETGFAGVVGARAHRVARIELGGAALSQVVVLSGPALDAELDRQSEWITRASGRALQLDGLLGWNVLREGSGGWRGDAALRALAFRPYAASPWPRAFVGVGVALRPVQDGLEILSVYEPSPAHGAGLEAGDVLLSVDGRPAAEAPTPFAPAGTPVKLRVSRGHQVFEQTVEVADLLPDSPAQ